MKKRNLLTVFIMVVLGSMLLMACGNNSTTANEQKEETAGNNNVKEESTEKTAKQSTNEDSSSQLRVGASTTSTWTYGFISSWAEVLEGVNPDTDMVVQATAGSSSHYLLMEKDKIDLGSGFAPNDFYSIEGKHNFDKSYTDHMAMIPTTTARGHVFTLADSDIKTLKDLDGVKLGVGSRGSPSSVVAEIQANALGIKPEFVFSTAGEMMEMVKDGRIDAAWYYAGAPWSAILDLTSRTDIKFIPFTEKDLSAIKEATPFASTSEFNSDIYEFVDGSLATPGLLQTINVSKDVPEDVVYEITKATWENWDKIVELVPAAGTVSVEDGANLVGKMHPGALKYYKEAGVEIPEKLK